MHQQILEEPGGGLSDQEVEERLVWLETYRSCIRKGVVPDGVWF
jgi:hypothetical protein